MENDSHISKLKIILTNIARERNRLGYTQEYMGLKMGMSQNGYSKIELGYTNITIDHLFQIATILDYPLEELLTEQEY